MLDINPDTVCAIISMARQFHAKEAVVIPEEPLSPSDDALLQVLADHADDPVYQELCETVRDLEPDQQICLVALMWLGRGDFEIEEWDDALREAGERWTPHTAEYLASTPLVSDYLMEALDLHGYGCD